MSDKDFSRLDPIVPESDERIGRDKPAAPRPSRSRGAPKNPRPAKESGGGLWKLLVLILMLGLGGLGYFFVQQTEQFTQLQNRFDNLEAKIVSTDESLNQSGTSLSIKLKDQEAELDKHWTEIKKLWGVSYDRNRTNIEAQKNTLEAQNKTLKGLQASMAARKKEIDGLKSAQGKAEKSLAAVVNAALAAKLETNDLVGQSQKVADQINSFEKSLAMLKQNLNTRVANNEEAIGAIDAYRLQVNRDLQQMKQQLGAFPVSSQQAP